MPRGPAGWPPRPDAAAGCGEVAARAPAPAPDGGSRPRLRRRPPQAARRRPPARPRRRPAPARCMPAGASGARSRSAVEEALHVGVVGVRSGRRRRERVGGAHRPRHGAGGVGDLERAQLVRDRHVRAGEAAGGQLAHDLGEALGLHVDRLVAPVEPELLEGRVVHRRRAAVADGVAQDGDERGQITAAQQFVGDLPPAASRAAL